MFTRVCNVPNLMFYGGEKSFINDLNSNDICL